MAVLAWKDTRDVTLCSTIHNAFGGNSVQRQITGKQAGAWSTQQIALPDPVRKYNKLMGGSALV